MSENRAMGPNPCVRGEPANAHGVGAWCGEGENKLRGTTTYCSACGRMTGVATVVFPPDEDMDELRRDWEREDKDTPLEWIHHCPPRGGE